MFCKVERTTDVSLLNLISSCLSTVFIDSSYTTGNKWYTYMYMYTHIHHSILCTYVHIHVVNVQIMYIVMRYMYTYTFTCLRERKNEVLLWPLTFSMLKSGGSLERISVANSSITCSGDLPAPPVTLGRVNNILSNNLKSKEIKKL